MSGDLISKKTRSAFREYFVGYTLREIRTFFDDADLNYDSGFNPGLGGERRTLVEQYYHLVDFADPKQISKVLDAFAAMLEDTYKSTATDEFQKARRESANSLLELLRRDGFKYQDGKITAIRSRIREQLSQHDPKRTITEITRRAIFDFLSANNFTWSGRLTEPEFLERLYDLEALPSTDSRYGTAAADIHQHQVMNTDWGADWIQTDSRFNLMGAPDEEFLQFLCMTVHPVVRESIKEVDTMVRPSISI